MRKTPTTKQINDAWEFIRVMREEWTVEDWADFYHGISFAFFKIEQRHKSKRTTGETWQQKNKEQQP